MKNEKRSERLTICCSKQDMAGICQAAQKTTCRSVSEYVRKVLLGKPVAVFYRNRSLDELIDRLASLQIQLDIARKRENIGPEEGALLQEIKLILIKIADNACYNKTESKRRKNLALP